MARGPSLLVYVGLAISGVCLYLFLRGIELDRLREALASMRLVHLPGVVALYAVSYPVRAWRWGYLLPRDPSATFRRRLSATLIGFMATSILPARAGEVVRGAAYALMTTCPVGTALASIVVERIFDLAFVLSALGVVLVVLPGEGSDTLAKARLGGLVLGAALVIAVVAIAFLKRWPTRGLALIDAAVGWLPEGPRQKVSAFARSVVAGLTVLASMADLVWVVVLTLFHWGLQIALLWLLGLAFDLPLGATGATLVFVFSALAVALPQAPGFIGVFQVVVEAALSLVKAPVYAAKGFAIVFWLVCVIPITIAGFVALGMEGLTLARVRGEAPRR